MSQSTYQNETAEVLDLPYQPPTAGAPLETFTLSSLLERRGRSELERRQRVDFELLIWCSAGRGRHEVDFEHVDLTPQRILHVRPGQVHRWLLDPPYEAELMLLRPLEHGRPPQRGPHLITIDEEQTRDAAMAWQLAGVDGRSAPLSHRGLEAVRHLVIALLGLDRAHGRGATHREIIFSEFEQLLGGSEPPPRSVRGCAQLLGCSTRTLTRACHAEADASPKQLIDRSIALEAQRRLGLGGASASEVAESLGFAELSHFSRFFVRLTGETPSGFAAGHG